MAYTDGATDEVVKVVIDGAEYSLKLAGEAAKLLGKLLVACVLQEGKSHGKMTMTNMIRSGIDQTAFAIRDEDFSKFARNAKAFGILYTVVKSKDKPDGLVNVIVRSTDAGKVNRLFDTFKISSVAKTDISVEDEKQTERKQEQETDIGKERDGGEVEETHQNNEDALDFLLSGKGEQENPTRTPDTESRSGNTSETQTAEEGSSDKSDKSENEKALDALFGNVEKSEPKKEKPEPEKETADLKSGQEQEDGEMEVREIEIYESDEDIAISELADDFRERAVDAVPNRGNEDALERLGKPENPTRDRAEKSGRSGNTSERGKDRKDQEERRNVGKPSVRQELRDIRTVKKQESADMQKGRDLANSKATVKGGRE